MSWIIGFSGTAAEVKLKMQEYSTLVTGEDKLEYDAAYPHLLELLKQSAGTPGKLI